MFRIPKPSFLPFLTRFTTSVGFISHHHLLQCQKSCRQRLHSTMPTPSVLTPSYDNALHLLSLLQSNKTVTNLFTTAPASKDLNALAIPEVIAWLARAGIHASTDLARLRCVHVAGTKGKGSVCAFTTSILRQYPSVAGKVGTYTSPHLVSVRERICLDGEPISQDLFAKYFFEVWNRLSDAARAAGDVPPEGDELGVDGASTKPFYFRFLTILAFHAFLREGVKSAVIECGIGGEYDSTNVLPAEAVTASVVTQLGIDHVAMLGDTLEKIAWNKAGIFKEGVPAFTRKLDDQDTVMRVLRDRAEEKGTQLVEIDDEDVEQWQGVLDANLEGTFQKSNMALAVAITRQHLEALGEKFDGNSLGLSDTPEPILRGLKAASLRGRCETISQDRIQWYIDGAHTDDSLHQVGKWFASKIKDKDTIRVLIFNQQDRDSVKLLQSLLNSIQDEVKIDNRKIFHHAFFPTNQPYTLSGGSKQDLTVQRKNCDVIRQFSPFTTALASDCVSMALDMAKNIVDASKKSKDNCKVQVLITGSFNLIGPALKLLEPGGEP